MQDVKSCIKIVNKLRRHFIDLAHIAEMDAVGAPSTFSAVFDQALLEASQLVSTRQSLRAICEAVPTSEMEQLALGASADAFAAMVQSGSLRTAVAASMISVVLGVWYLHAATARASQARAARAAAEEKARRASPLLECVRLCRDTHKQLNLLLEAVE